MLRSHKKSIVLNEISIKYEDYNKTNHLKNQKGKLTSKQIYSYLHSYRRLFTKPTDVHCR